MTTKTDNYRELAEQLRSEDKLCEPEGDCPHCCELRLKMRGADAIDALIKERDDALGFKAWIRKKLESSNLCQSRTDELVATDSEIFGWMHVVVANAQSWKNILPRVDRRNHEQQNEIKTLARENERLLECVKEYARREIEAGESGDGLAQDCLAALANAPTRIELKPDCDETAYLLYEYHIQVLPICDGFDAAKRGTGMACKHCNHTERCHKLANAPVLNDKGK